MLSRYRVSMKSTCATELALAGVVLSEKRLHDLQAASIGWEVPYKCIYSTYKGQDNSKRHQHRRHCNRLGEITGEKFQE